MNRLLACLTKNCCRGTQPPTSQRDACGCQALIAKETKA